MLSLPLGPIALPLPPLLLALAAWLAMVLAGRLTRRFATVPGAAAAADAAAPAAEAVARRAVVDAVLVGLVAARLGYVTVHAEAYFASPLLVLDLRDGGWLAPLGALAGLGWLAWRGWRRPALRRALAAGVLAGSALWLLGTWASGGFRPAMLPALTLHDLQRGVPVTLHEAARGRPLVVNLWASWCGPCRVEMPMLAAAQQREPQVGFLFVNQGESAQTVQRYLQGSGLVLHEVLLDPASSAAAAFGSRGLPTTLFFDADGRRVDAHFGVLNSAALASRIAAWRRPPPTTMPTR